jgi:hypothetical protein
MDNNDKPIKLDGIFFNTIKTNVKYNDKENGNSNSNTEN